jgi:hypothetical protein
MYLGDAGLVTLERAWPKAHDFTVSTMLWPPPAASAALSGVALQCIVAAASVLCPADDSHYARNISAARSTDCPSDGTEEVGSRYSLLSFSVMAATCSKVPCTRWSRA